MTAAPSPAAVVARPKIRVRSLDFYYGAFRALHEITLDIPAQQVTAFIGPSGCGKSTLLRVLNRIFELYPDHRAVGRVELDGRNILTAAEDVNLIRACVGMVFQKATPFPMSVWDNVAFGAQLFERMTRAALRERVEWALHRAALWDEVKDKLRVQGTRLSGGQQQRLCIARAIAARPQVLLLDEPASALDPISTQKIEDLVIELKRDYTLVMVTHNLQQARRIADYTAFMYLGRLIEFGRTAAIFDHPSVQRTRDYVAGRYG